METKTQVQNRLQTFYDFNEIYRKGLEETSISKAFSYLGHVMSARINKIWIRPSIKHILKDQRFIESYQKAVIYHKKVQKLADRFRTHSQFPNLPQDLAFLMAKLNEELNIQRAMHIESDKDLNLQLAQSAFKCLK